MHEVRIPAKRELAVDAAKGIGATTIVISHFGVQSNIILNMMFQIHVPIFFFLSGYMSSSKKNVELKREIGHKAKRLLLPYLGWSGFLLICDVVLKTIEGSFSWRKLLQSIVSIIYCRAAVFYPFGYGSNPSQIYMMNVNIQNGALWFLPAMFMASLILLLDRKSVV